MRRSPERQAALQSCCSGVGAIVAIGLVMRCGVLARLNDHQTNRGLALPVRQTQVRGGRGARASIYEKSIENALPAQGVLAGQDGLFQLAPLSAAAGGYDGRRHRLRSQAPPPTGEDLEPRTRRRSGRRQAAVREGARRKVREFARLHWQCDPKDLKSFIILRQLAARLGFMEHTLERIRY